jgi:FkbM family methyltransferase
MPADTIRARLVANQRFLSLARRARDGVVWLATPTPELREWRRIDGDRTLRLDYDLGPDSVVLDVGGFEGQWASDIVAKYGCRVHVFEPVPAYARRISERFARNPLVQVHAAGLAAADGSATLSVAGDASSQVRDGGAETVTVPLRGIAGVLEEVGDGPIHLVKLNIEGAEYDLVEHIVETGIIRRIVDLQVQFHTFVPDAEERMRALRTRLAVTHHPTFQYDFLWENWRLSG